MNHQPVSLGTHLLFVIDEGYALNELSQEYFKSISEDNLVPGEKLTFNALIS